MTKNKTVLIIEDDETIRELLQDFLALYGFDPYSADNCFSALDLLEKTRFDIIITDYWMPGMDGLQLVRRIRPGHPQVFIVGISGNCSRNDFLQAGANAFLPKPFRLQDLLSLLRC